MSVEGDRLRPGTQLALRSHDRALLVPRVIAELALDEWLDTETPIGGVLWSGNDEPLEHRLDTRLHLRSPAPFFDELEGEILAIA